MWWCGVEVEMVGSGTIGEMLSRFIESVNEGPPTGLRVSLMRKPDDGGPVMLVAEVEDDDFAAKFHFEMKYGETNRKTAG